PPSHLSRTRTSTSDRDFHPSPVFLHPRTSPLLIRAVERCPSARPDSSANTVGSSSDLDAPPVPVPTASRLLASPDVSRTCAAGCERRSVPWRGAPRTERVTTHPAA